MRKPLRLLRFCILLSAFGFLQVPELWIFAEGTEDPEALRSVDGFCGASWGASMKDVFGILERRGRMEGEDCKSGQGYGSGLSYISMEEDQDQQYVYVFDDDRLVGGQYTCSTDNPGHASEMISQYSALFGTPDHIINTEDGYPFLLWVDEKQNFVSMYTSESLNIVFQGQPDPAFIEYASAYENWYDIRFSDVLSESF